MAVSVTDPVAGPFYPNGVTTAFPFSFKAMSASEVAVVDGNGDPISGFSYSATLTDPEGGQVVFAVAPTADALPSFYIASDPDFQQLTQFGSVGAFNPRTLNGPLDRQAVATLALRSRLMRSISLPLDSTSVAGKFPVVLPDGTQGFSTGTGADAGLRTDLAVTTGAALVKANDGNTVQDNLNHGGYFQQIGTGAVKRTSQDKSRDAAVSVKDFGAVGDGIADDTAPCQAAIDTVEAAGGGFVFFPRGTYRCNLFFGHRVKLRGDGRVCTTLKPAAALPVIQCPIGKSVTRIGVEDMYLQGDYAYTDADVINLQPSGLDPDGNKPFADDILLQNLLIENAGRDNVFVAGQAAAGPFVQRLKMDTCEVRNAQGNNLSLRGTVLETKVTNCSFSRVAGTPGTGASIAIAFFNDDYPLRVRFTSCIIDNAALPDGSAYGVLIDAGANISFRSTNFEFCGPAIATSENPFAAGFTAIDCNFGFGGDVDTVILIKNSRAVRIENCSVRVGAGHTITNFVKLDGSMGTPDDSATGIKNITLRDNTRDGSITNWVYDPASFYQTISSGNIRKWRDTIIVLGEGAAADDLVNIFSSGGGNTLFAMGEEVTLFPFANFENVTVKHGTGNLRLSGGADYILDSQNKSITFRWNTQTQYWNEVSRA